MNLKQLSQHLGLSQTTVSRALNGFPEVNESTRARVVAAAQHVGYRPNAAARRLATGRAGAFGMLLPNERSLLHESLFRPFLAGLMDELAGGDHDLMITPTRSDEAAEYRRLVTRGRVDGFVVNRPRRDDPRVPILTRLGVPFVIHGRTDTAVDYSFVDIDNEGAFRSLTDLLLDLGHRRIGLLNDETQYFFANCRALGYRAALRTRGVPHDPALERAMVMSEANGYRATRELMEAEGPPTALICGSVYLVEGAYRALRDLGLEPGRDVSVVAHDDVVGDVEAEVLRPALTASTSSIGAAGARIGRFLLQMVEEGRPGPLQEIWTPEVTLRNSAQPLRRRAA